MKVLLLREEILHQLICSLSQSGVFTRFYTSKVVSRISSINSIITDSSITAPPSLESFKPGGKVVWVFHHLGNLPKSELDDVNDYPGMIF